VTLLFCAVFITVTAVASRFIPWWQRFRYPFAGQGLVAAPNGHLITPAALEFSAAGD
jgi:hypothetical protein